MWVAINKQADNVAAGGSPDLSDAARSRIRELLARYPGSAGRAALLPALHLAQDEIGWLPDKTLLQVAELLNLSPAEVLDAASFYDMFWRKPKGRKLVQVCEGFSCELCGQVNLLAAVEKKLGIKPGQTTPDGQFTLVTVQCLAACDRGPVVHVNDQLFERVTPEGLDAVPNDE